MRIFLDARFSFCQLFINKLITGFYSGQKIFQNIKEGTFTFPLFFFLFYKQSGVKITNFRQLEESRAQSLFVNRTVKQRLDSLMTLCHKFPRPRQLCQGAREEKRILSDTLSRTVSTSGNTGWSRKNPALSLFLRGLEQVLVISSQKTERERERKKSSPVQMRSTIQLVKFNSNIKHRFLT